MSLTNSPEIAEGEGNKLAKGSGRENENEQKADTEITQKETYLFMYLGSWETGNSERNQDEEREANIPSVYQMDLLILTFYSGNSTAFI